MDVVAGGGGARAAKWWRREPRTREQLARVHDEQLLERIAGNRRPGDRARSRHVHLARDATRSRCSRPARRWTRSSGVIGGPNGSALALVRPPGHHAERDQAMGFCFYNNVAVAAAHARALGRRPRGDRGLRRPPRQRHAAMFEQRSQVLYISTHQYPFYPGTGGADEIGKDEGEASPSTCRSKSAPPTRTTVWCLPSSSCPSSGSSCPTPAGVGGVRRA